MNPHGWVTYLSAAGGAVTGLTDIFVNHNTMGGLKMIVAAVAAIGFRGAIAKVIRALQGLGIGAGPA